MKHLFSRWDKIGKRVSKPALFLFLDYDGTLSKIAKTPQKAALPKHTKSLIKRLSKTRGIKVAIISGRYIKDIKNKIGLKDIIYAGNHGLEITGHGIKFVSPLSKKYIASIKAINADLKRRLARVRGVIIEDKGLSLSVHYRLAKKDKARLVKNILMKSTFSYILKGIVCIKYGKKVFEIRPSFAWDKGKAVLYILAKEKAILSKARALPVYIGDDVTDEDAFRALRQKGITVFVGKPRASHAAYYLRGPKEVKDFLNKVLVCRN